MDFRSSFVCHPNIRFLPEPAVFAPPEERSARASSAMLPQRSSWPIVLNPDGLLAELRQARNAIRFFFDILFDLLCRPGRDSCSTRRLNRLTNVLCEGFPAPPSPYPFFTAVIFLSFHCGSLHLLAPESYLFPCICLCSFAWLRNYFNFLKIYSLVE